ncbi:NAD-P-binding protein [Irpex rosettiformis]|uniref:NAD-P-binding protein n=1 Tax=Irpex rosettiformis TaxID=378272 RepID=A0ACB8U1P3_9APHY|nr:NAD-P-binding protein [Irpex rosettiformis]
MSSLPLQGKVALVTGSSRAIGAAVVKRLAADGASVVVNYVSNPDAANAVVDDIHSSTPGKAIALKGDMSSVPEAENLVEETIKHYGKIDILVLNAGIMNPKLLKDIDEKSYDDHFNMNVKVPLFMVKRATKYLQPGGRVIFISTSLTKFSGVPPSYVLYNATKGAVEQLVRVLAKDLGSNGITVNAVAPGPTNTELFTTGKSEQLIQFFSSLHPMKRIAEPNEISPVVAMLARDESVWVNGQTIFVNGGYAV